MKQRISRPVNVAGNGERIRHIAIDTADASALFYALSLGANTAMLCGHYDAEARLRYYADIVRQLAPAGARFFSRKETLCEIVIAMGENEAWTMLRQKHRFRDKLDVSVSVGPQIWDVARDLDDEHADEIEACLQALAPMTCQQIDWADWPQKDRKDHA